VSDVDDAIFRVLLAKPGNGLAALGRIFRPVDAQTERSEASEAAALEVPDPELFFMLLGRRFRVDAPPAWQIFSDQDDADGPPDVGDAVGQCDQFAAVRQNSCTDVRTEYR
jgi:hypothetical protein